LLTASWASAVPNNAEVKEKSINFMLIRPGRVRNVIQR
jgi:hypothetical protein